SCPPEQGEGRFDLLPARGFLSKPFVDCGQFILCRFVFGASKFCLDFERKLCQLLLPVFRPGRDAFQYCPHFVFGHDVLSDPGRSFRTMPQRSMPPMQRYLTSRNSSMPYFEPSRPMPLSFMPPKGAISVEMMPSLMPTMPYSSASATRQMR